MKRILSMLCIAMLMLMPVQAFAAEGDLIVARTSDESRYGFDSSCSAGDTLYILFYNRDMNDPRTLGVHRAGEAEMRQYRLQIGEPLEDSGNCYESIRLFSDGERVYALREIFVYEENVQSVQAGLYEISIDGESAQATLICEPDLSIFKSGNEYNAIRFINAVEGRAVMVYYDDSGLTHVVGMNLSDGAFEAYDQIDGEIINMAPYTNNQMLIQQYADYDGERVQFLILDPAAGSIETALEMDVPQYEPYNDMACDRGNGNVYYSKQGELFELNLQTGESGEAITDMPESGYSDIVATVLDGGYYASANYDCYIIRNLHPAQKSDKRLKIYDGSYDDCVTRAFFALSNAHGDDTVLLSRDYNSAASLVDDMMNRSSDIDVYIMSSDDASYESVYTRGYIADMMDSEKMRAAADRMYPAMRDALSIDGRLCALPVNCYFWLPYLNEGTLEKLNMTVEDVPDNWWDFLDFLMELPEKLPADGSVGLMDPWMSNESAKRSIFECIFRNYQQLLQKNPNAFSADQMAALLEKLDRVDFQALGQPAEADLDYEADGNNYSNYSYLLEMNMGTTLGGISKQHPMVMSMSADTPKLLAVSTSIAFINPYSKNTEMALEFIELLADNLPDETNYAIYSDLNAPVENPYYAEEMQRLQESIEKLRAQYEAAKAVDRQDLQQQLTDFEQVMKDFEEERYSISDKDIAWIHEFGDALILQGNNWLYSGDSGEAYQLVQEYCAGQTNAQTLMNEIGRKIRMMMMENY